MGRHTHLHGRHALLDIVEGLTRVRGESNTDLFHLPGGPRAEVNEIATGAETRAKVTSDRAKHPSFSPSLSSLSAAILYNTCCVKYA